MRAGTGILAPLSLNNPSRLKSILSPTLYSYPLAKLNDISISKTLVGGFSSSAKLLIDDSFFEISGNAKR
jgi:hypothetical protein